MSTQQRRINQPRVSQLKILFFVAKKSFFCFFVFPKHSQLRFLVHLLNSAFVHPEFITLKIKLKPSAPFFGFPLQNLLSFWGRVGQLPAQLPPAEPSDSLRREDLHDLICVSGGLYLLHLCTASPSLDGCLPLCSSSSWTTASSLPSSPKTSAWCSTRGTLRSPLLVLSGTCLGADTLKLLTGEALNWYPPAALS